MGRRGRGTPQDMSEQDSKDLGIWNSQAGLLRVLHGTLAMTKPDGGLQGRTECGCDFQMLSLSNVMLRSAVGRNVSLALI